MKTLNILSCRPRTCGLAMLVSCLTFLGTCNTLAQPMPPLIPGRLLNFWRFNDTNLLTARQTAPIEVAGVALVDGIATNGVYLGGTSPAILRYNIVEPTDRTNIVFSKGTARFWFRPDWESGVGSDDFARLIEVGIPTNDAAIGWWSLYCDTAGTNLIFAAQSNGMTATYAVASLSWSAAEWHQVCLTWSETNSFIYLDGILAGSGTGVSLTPNTNAQGLTGLLIGSDTAGGGRASGTIDELAIYDFPLSASQVASDYEGAWNRWFGSLFNDGFFGDNMLDIGDIGFDPGLMSYGQYLSTDLWLELVPATSTNATLLLHNTIPGTNYPVLVRETVASGAWVVLSEVTGASGTNVTSLSVSTTPLPIRFFWVGEDWDSDGVLDFKDADPRDAAVGVLTITIDTPSNGSILQ